MCNHCSPNPPTTKPDNMIIDVTGIIKQKRDCHFPKGNLFFYPSIDLLIFAFGLAIIGLDLVAFLVVDLLSLADAGDLGFPIFRE